MTNTRKVVFLDRDGTLNSNANHYYVYKVDDVVINEGVFEGLQLLIQAGFSLIIVTNQGGVSKGIYTQEEVRAVNEYLIDCFAQEQIPILDVFFCTHHDSIENCLCRKPKSLMLERAIALHHIDVTQSYFLGDGTSDLEAALRVGVKGVKIMKNENIIPYCKQIVSETNL